MINKVKYLTIEDRNYVEDELSENYSLALIANRLEKDLATIFKEIELLLRIYYLSKK